MSRSQSGTSARAGGSIESGSFSTDSAKTRCSSIGDGSSSPPTGPISRNQSGISTGSTGALIGSVSSASSAVDVPADTRSCDSQSSATSSPESMGSTTGSVSSVSSVVESRSCDSQSPPSSSISIPAIVSATGCSFKGTVGNEKPLIGVGLGSSFCSEGAAIGTRRALHLSQ